MDNNMMLLGLVILALIAVAIWMFTRKKESEKLEQRFGPEYNRTVDELGSRDKAEVELRAREKRVDQLNIVSLKPAEAERFSQAWRTLQARFVDHPKEVLTEADLLVRELMQKRGYPMGDFDRRAADISVHHPAVVDHYRAAHDIAVRDKRGEVDTEGLRQAVIHYRALFAELLQIDGPAPAADRSRASTSAAAMPATTAAADTSIAPSAASVATTTAAGQNHMETQS